jgi:hypothetical protein
MMDFSFVGRSNAVPPQETMIEFISLNILIIMETKSLANQEDPTK